MDSWPEPHKGFIPQKQPTNQNNPCHSISYHNHFIILCGRWRFFLSFDSDLRLLSFITCCSCLERKLNKMILEWILGFLWGGKRLRRASTVLRRRTKWTDCRCLTSRLNIKLQSPRHSGVSKRKDKSMGQNRAWKWMHTHTLR